MQRIFFVENIFIELKFIAKPSILISINLIAQWNKLWLMNDVNYENDENVEQMDE